MTKLIELNRLNEKQMKKVAGGDSFRRTWPEETDYCPYCGSRAIDWEHSLTFYKDMRYYCYNCYITWYVHIDQ